ncbi:MAG: AAA family ATPase [Saprospiraceae bacterium]|nr:AAA family ATPase [Saprospiraceae bacterium]
MHEEIEELKKAIEASPENVYLRMLLVRKMRPFDQYLQEAEQQLETVMELEKQNREARELLVEIFFRQGKNSAAIVLGEDLLEQTDVSPGTKLILSKAYYAEEDFTKSRDLYEEVLMINPSMTDQQLDHAFRLGSAYDEDDENDYLLEKPKVTFQDVGGLDDIKREIDLKIIKPLEHADLYAAYGKKVGGGILLYGPPGCGKTFLARATAGEINAGFINVTLNDILDMWVGNSEKQLNAIFEEARDNAPCVLFFDEIDALGAKRSDLRQSAGKNVINQFLSELDGVEASNDGVLVIGATNVPWHLDAAFRRPGRFDRVIFVPPPDLDNRAEILKIKLADKPKEHIDYHKLAKLTPHYSGADLEAVIDIAIESVLETAMQTGAPQPLTTDLLKNAISKHRSTTIDWFTTAKNYAVFANQSGQYDAISEYLKKHKDL